MDRWFVPVKSLRETASKVVKHNKICRIDGVLFMGIVNPWWINKDIIQEIFKGIVEEYKRIIIKDKIFVHHNHNGTVMKTTEHKITNTPDHSNENYIKFQPIPEIRIMYDGNSDVYIITFPKSVSVTIANYRGYPITIECPITESTNTGSSGHTRMIIHDRWREYLPHIKYFSCRYVHIDRKTLGWPAK